MPVNPTIHRILMLGGVTLLPFVSSPLSAEILTVYADSGFYAGSTGVPVYSGCGTPSASAVADGQNRDLSVVPEGRASWKMSDNDPSDCYFGWGVTYSPMDLSRFNSGELRFWLYSTVENLKLEIKDAGDGVVLLYPITFTSGQLNRWSEIRIPFAGHVTGSGLSQVITPFLITSLQAPGAFYVDNVRYVDSTVGSPAFDVSLKNIGDNSPAAEVTWSSVALPAGWVRADQYFLITVDAATPGWGVQIYTDNTAGDANPKYTGVISDVTPVPSGLVDVVDTTRRLPLAWATRSDVSTITVVAADPNNASDLHSFQWLVAEDKAQVAVPSQSAAAFQNGDLYITAINNLGIHYGQSAAEFGAENPPYRIYLEADFSGAVTPRTYRTSTLRIEAFTE